MSTRLAISWKTCLFQKKALSRYLSTNAKKTAEALDNKAFTDTLLLPKTTFPLRPNFKEIEAAYGDLTRETLYRWQVWIMFKFK
jgi:isoleucyl-tRNA synthetase